MRRILAQLELISAVPATNLEATHGSDEDPLGTKPPGDYGYLVYARWYGPPFHEPTTEYPGCRTNTERTACLEAAESELEHLRKTTRPVVMEAPDKAVADMLAETEGWSLEDVARSHWRTSPTMMRRLRVADGRDAETGRFVTLSGENAVERAIELRQRGLSLRQIGMVLHVDEKQVRRYLRKAA